MSARVKGGEQGFREREREVDVYFWYAFYGCFACFACFAFKHLGVGIGRFDQRPSVCLPYNAVCLILLLGGLLACTCANAHFVLVTLAVIRVIVIGIGWAYWKEKKRWIRE